MPKFHVYIIESPNPADLYHKRFEGEALTQTLKLSGLESSHRLAVNREAFNASFLIGLSEYFKAPGFLPPIIHISAHGDDNGIQLTSGEEVSWDELKELLKPANAALNGHLLVSISACNGFSGCRMAMKDDDPPCLVIVGSLGKPKWSETNIGFATLYHLLANKKHISEAVTVMKQASGHEDFALIYSSDARQIYLNANKIDQLNASKKFEKNMPESQPSTLAKALNQTAHAD